MEDINVKKSRMTAEEFIDNKYKDFEELDSGCIWTNIENLMIEFAQYHVEQALKSADNNAEICVIDACYDTEPPTPVYGVESNSILNAYPKENIK